MVTLNPAEVVDELVNVLDGELRSIGVGPICRPLRSLKPTMRFGNVSESREGLKPPSVKVWVKRLKPKRNSLFTFGAEIVVLAQSEQLEPLGKGRPERGDLRCGVDRGVLRVQVRPRS